MFNLLQPGSGLLLRAATLLILHNGGSIVRRQLPFVAELQRKARAVSKIAKPFMAVWRAMAHRAEVKERLLRMQMRREQRSLGNITQIRAAHAADAAFTAEELHYDQLDAA
ncbi:hypothetical protein [Tardiphaga sp.]|uniref:hypothetical protein n=1 Tax=Tardiphaga sp. TaxID=1926292 RepID=UPI0026139C15|nr:hypothetical protein [Tardiphaga sp.]MDB5620071.1 hypothetical protein [Tardiphaga sp.]